MKKIIFKTVTPIFLLLLGVLFLGQGCNCGGNPLNTIFLDADADGYGDPAVSTQDNDVPPGYVTNSDDCDDSNPDVYFGAIEIADNNIDESCNGLYAYTFYADADGDGFGDAFTSQVIEINLGDNAPNGFSENNTDCDDTDASVNPLAQEIPGNNIDDNCNGETDTDVCAFQGYSALNTSNNAQTLITDSELSTQYFPNASNGPYGAPGVEIASFSSSPTLFFVTNVITLNQTGTGYLTLDNGQEQTVTVTCLSTGSAVGDQMRFGIIYGTTEAEFCVVIDEEIL